MFFSDMIQKVQIISPLRIGVYRDITDYRQGNKAVWTQSSVAKSNLILNHITVPRLCPRLNFIEILCRINPVQGLLGFTDYSVSVVRSLFRCLTEVFTTPLGGLNSGDMCSGLHQTTLKPPHSASASASAQCPHTVLECVFYSGSC